MNKVLVMGNITKDLELKKTSTGKSVLEFSVAVNNGEQTEFINIQAWEKNADTIAMFFGKGNKILIEGRIHTSSYEGRNGKVYKTLVICDRFEFVEPKSKKEDEPKQDIYMPNPSSKVEDQITFDTDALPFY